MDWDDLKFVLAVAREGSLGGAARSLKVAHSTVARRLKACEEKLSAEIFERNGDQLVASEGGLELVRAAEEIEALVHEAEGRLQGTSDELDGELNVTTLDVVGELLAADFMEFAATYPQIKLNLTLGYSLADMSRREADVAIRAANDPPPHLVGRRAGALEFAVYARSDLVERSKFDDLRDLPWVLFQESLRAVMTEEWVTERVGAKRIVARVDSVMMMRDLVRQGAGAAVLPCALGEEGLVQVTPALPGFSLDLWVLTHPNLRGNRRVKLALEHFSAALKRAESKLSANPV